MIQIQPPKLIYTPDDPEYVPTYVLDEEGNPTNDLKDYEKLEDGFYAISDKYIEDLIQYIGSGSWSPLSGVKTYCYQWSDKDAYELDFPPESIEEYYNSGVVEGEDITSPPAPEPYDLGVGKYKATSIINNWYNEQFTNIRGKYPETMLLSFPTKKEEALRVLAGGESTFLDQLDKEGRTTLEYAVRILELSEVYQQGLTQIENIWNTKIKAISLASGKTDIDNILKGFI